MAQGVAGFSLLYAEDDAQIAQSILPVLKETFMHVIVAADGNEAQKALNSFDFDAALLDIRLPQYNGFELAAMLREQSPKTQIIITSSYHDMEHLRQSIRLQAIDFLPKPYSYYDLREALSRCIEALAIQQSSGLFHLGSECFFDPARHCLRLPSGRLDLSKNEALFLELLCRLGDETLTYERINADVFGYEGLSDTGSIKNLTYRLRKKVGFDFLTSVHGIGYRLA